MSIISMNFSTRIMSILYTSSYNYEFMMYWIYDVLNNVLTKISKNFYFKIYLYNFNSGIIYIKYYWFRDKKFIRFRIIFALKH